MSRRKTLPSVRSGKRSSRRPFKYLRDYDPDGYRHVRMKLMYHNWVCSTNYSSSKDYICGHVI